MSYGPRENQRNQERQRFLGAVTEQAPKVLADLFQLSKLFFDADRPHDLHSARYGGGTKKERALFEALKCWRDKYNLQHANENDPWIDQVALGTLVTFAFPNRPIPKRLEWSRRYFLQLNPATLGRQESMRTKNLAEREGQEIAKVASATCEKIRRRAVTSGNWPCDLVLSWEWPESEDMFRERAKNELDKYIEAIKEAGHDELDEKVPKRKKRDVNPYIALVQHVVLSQALTSVAEKMGVARQAIGPRIKPVAENIGLRMPKRGARAAQPST